MCILKISGSDISAEDINEYFTCIYDNCLHYFVEGSIMSQSSKHTINDVKNFWESHPLFAGESTHLPGTKEFFEDHRKTVIEDCLGGEFQEDLYIPQTVSKQSKILDLGCGIGFWTIEFLLRGYTNTSALFREYLPPKA